MQLRGLGERYKLPNGVWGKAPAEIEFGAFYPYNMIFGSSNFTNYRAMHYSAKRHASAMPRKARYCACMSSIRPSVTLVDQEHIRWKSWKLITHGHFALPSPKVIYLLPRKHEKILRRLDVRLEKWRAGAQKGG